jgi:hypothetical protein
LRVTSRGLGDVYKRQLYPLASAGLTLLAAVQAGFTQGNLQVLGDSTVCVLERNLEIMVAVSALLGSTRSTKGPTEHLGEDVIGVESGWARGTVNGPPLIEVLALLWVAEDVIGSLDLLEFFGVTRWFIRVKSKSEFTIGLLDLLF